MPSKMFKLPPSEIAKLQEAQRQLHDVLQEYPIAEECGMDCTAWRQLHQEAYNRIDALLRNYGAQAGK